MVTFRLIEETDQYLTYWYFPNGNEDEMYGIILIDKLNETVEIQKMAHDDFSHIVTVDEQNEARNSVNEMRREEGLPFKEDVELGIMIETPAASLMADVFAKEADFFSIGTNDLTGYTMAVDRGNAAVAYLYSAYNPAVLRSIERVIKAGRAEGIMVGMCGEAAADPLLAPLLISFGMNEFSVSATSILATRKGISLWTKEEADAVAAKAMSLTTEAEVEAYLKSVAKH